MRVFKAFGRIIAVIGMAELTGSLLFNSEFYGPIYQLALNA